MSIFLLWLALQQIISGSVNITAHATDPVIPNQTTSGIATVQYFLDGTILGSLSLPTTLPDIYSIPWDTTTTTNGLHTVMARATDNAGNVGTASLTVNVQNSGPDTTPPTIQFVTPIAGSTVTGKINIQANATDNVSVQSMALFIAGQQKATGAGSSIIYNWNTAPYKKKVVTLTVTATDPSGNIGTTSINVNVK